MYDPRNVRNPINTNPAGVTVNGVRKRNIATVYTSMPNVLKRRRYVKSLQYVVMI